MYHFLAGVNGSGEPVAMVIPQVTSVNTVLSGAEESVVEERLGWNFQNI